MIETAANQSTPVEARIYNLGNMTGDKPDEVLPFGSEDEARFALSSRAGGPFAFQILPV